MVVKITWDSCALTVIIKKLCYTYNIFLLDSLRFYSLIPSLSPSSVCQNKNLIALSLV